METVLVTAASGQTGTRLIRLLTQRGVKVKALVRRATSAETVAKLGADAVVGDAWIADDLDRAFDGVQRVYHIAPSLTYNEPELGALVVAAAQRAQVRHFVLHGVMAPYLDNINYHWAKQLIQRQLYRSGLAYTVLLPTNYMQNVAWTWPTIERDGHWVLPYSVERKLTWVDLDDVAQAAAIVLTEPGHEYGTYELCGTDSFLSRAGIAALMSETFGKPIAAVKESPQAYLERAKSQPFFGRFREEEVQQILAMFDDYDRFGMPAGNPHVLSMLLNRPATSYRQFLARLARTQNDCGKSGVTSYGLPGA